MTRVDLALALEHYPWADEDDRAWLLGRGRDLRRSARFACQVAMHRAGTAITTRVEGWRKLGEPKGYSFAPWSNMGEEAFRRQCHLGIARGSMTAARHLSLLLVSDVRAA